MSFIKQDEEQAYLESMKNMCGKHHSMVPSERCLSCKVEALEAKVAQLEAENQRFARYFLQREAPGDWACKECRPTSDMLIEGFQCVFHLAQTRQALTLSPSDSKE